MGNESSIPCAAEVAWEELKSAGGTPPSAREAHCLFEYGGSMFVFGGVGDAAELAVSGDEENEEMGPASVTLNDFFRLDPATGVWEEVVCSGTAPSPRGGFAAVVLGKQLVVFGGIDPYVGWMADTFLLDLESFAWTPVAPSETAPSPRDKMAACAHPDGKTMLLFGGFGPQEDPDGGEAPEEQTATFGWFNSLHAFDVATASWREIACTGEAPTPRAAAGASVLSRPALVKKAAPAADAAPAPAPGAEGEATTDYVEDGPEKLFLYVACGRDAKGRLNDVFSLDLETAVWEQASTRGQKPVVRSFHSCATLGSHHLLVFGGADERNQTQFDVNVLDTRAPGLQAWLQPTVRQDLSCPARAYQAACCAGGAFYVHGGASAFGRETGEHQAFLTDIWRLDPTALLQFKTPTIAELNAAKEAAAPAQS
mmetsp:Transcript_11096/g.45243  ORF Transcript_11096/g.45243 Transcript_11096/m.45243 type:complete len:426 (+) Transcript_11096:43-1320(+)